MGKDTDHKLNIWCLAHLEGLMVRRVDLDGETLVWSRTCSGYAPSRLGPKLMNRCRPESQGAKEHGNMLKIILKLEEGGVPDRSAKGWKVEGRVKKKECKRSREDFEVGVITEPKESWNIDKKRMLEDRGLPKHEGDLIRECKAVHEENFLSSWLRDDTKGVKLKK